MKANYLLVALAGCATASFSVKWQTVKDKECEGERGVGGSLGVNNHGEEGDCYNTNDEGYWFSMDMGKTDDGCGVHAYHSLDCKGNPKGTFRGSDECIWFKYGGYRSVKPYC